MQKPEFLEFHQERIRVLHYTWIAFFITFYVWFNMAPLASTMLKSIGWLTKEHLKIFAICNVALTIPARIVVGALIDKYGPRRIFSLLMIVMAFPVFFFAFGNTFTQLLISRLLLGCIGAGFVIGIRMVSQWFPPKMLGRAEGLYAGWGNFGSAWAAMTLPWFALTVCEKWLNLGPDSWRWALCANGLVSLIYGIMYYYLVQDEPDGKEFIGHHKAEPMKVTSYGDLIQYIIWSFPLIGAMAILAWRIGGITIDEKPVLSSTIVHWTYIVLGLMYVAHVIKTLQVNLPDLKKGYAKEDQYHWGSVAALNSTYFANFGAELAVVSMLPMFFETVFKNLTNSNGNMIMTATLAGMIASSFAFVNLFARPLGGLLSDKMAKRKTTMLVYMFGIAIGFLGMSFIAKYGPLAADGAKTLLPMFEGVWWVVVSIIITITCSIFVQGAEGATFAVIPLIHKPQTGQVAGMAGAYGNVGAVCYLVIFSLVDAKSFFLILSVGAFLSLIACWILLEEPKASHAVIEPSGEHSI